LVLSGWWLYRRRRKGPPALLPDEWALRELDRLTLPSAASEGAVERFHTEISDVVRRYLELRFRLPALEQTTVEFFEAVRQSPHMNIPEQAILRDFLEHCDLVKFARARPEAPECQNMVAMARRFVEQTASSNHESCNGAKRTTPSRTS